jgi:poly-beta-1,6-N-acetyl-D-glucosamine synthase
MMKTIILTAYFLSLYLVIFWLLTLLEKGTSSTLKKLKILPTISLCIPAYNEEKTIKETLDSATNLDYPKDKIEIIVVNDGSTDKTKSITLNLIKKYKKDNIILINQKNKGKGAAMNTALKIAKNEYFISLDADSIVNKNALKLLLPHFYHDNIAAVLPVIEVQHKSTILRKIQHCEYLINFYYKKIMSSLNCIHVTPGPFAVYKRKIIKSLGGFDENNLVEDLEMAVKIQKANFEIVQTLETSVLTKAPENFIQFYKQRNRWYKGSLLTIFDYRKMIFNRSYGDFGVLQLPMVFVCAFVSITLFLIAILWRILQPLIIKLHDLSYINYDFIPLFVKGIKNYNILNINFVPMFYGYVILILSAIFLIASYHNAGYRLRHNKKPIFYYVFFYPFMIGIIWLGVLIDILRGKIQKW